MTTAAIAFVSFIGPELPRSLHNIATGPARDLLHIGHRLRRITG
jgi:hypothetical protein